jgi:hypothetical protein
MDVTRQTVNKTFNAIDARVSKALLEAAQVNRVEISRVDPKRGFLLGRSPSLGIDVLVTFSERNGIMIWYRGEGGCSGCSWRSSCKQKLLIEAEDKGLPLPDVVEGMEPSQLAEALFTKIMKE